MSSPKVAKEKMEAAIDHLKKELRNIRTGRANPGLLDQVQVEVYGTAMQLRDVASVTAPEPRQLLITPFDANNAGAISKGIEKANLGMQPVIDGNAVRITIPPLDESQRKEMVKIINKRKEEGKVSIRNVRRECNDSIRKQKADGDIPEDLMKKQEKSIQELTDKFCAEADTIAAEKEKEVMVI